ncbi:MAG: ABC transporter permease [Casimicrobiaceae bacterium]
MSTMSASTDPGLPLHVVVRALWLRPETVAAFAMLLGAIAVALGASLVDGQTLQGAVLRGVRTSVGLGVLSAVIALALGGAIGVASVYVGRPLRMLTMGLMDLQRGLPAIFLAFLLIAWRGHGTQSTILALVLVQWADYARGLHDAAQEERRRPYLEAARGLGLSAARILFVHLLPNCMRSLLAILLRGVAAAILLEATLSFLGLGIGTDEPSLGRLVASAMRAGMVPGAGVPWPLIAPGAALAALLLALHVVGDTLADRRAWTVLP